MNISAILMTAFFAFCDVLIVYFMTNNLCGFKASIAFKKIRVIPAISILTAFFTFHALSAFLLSEAVYGTLIPFTLLIFVWLFVEKKKVILSLDEIILIWFLIYAVIHLLFIPFLVIIRIFAATETHISLLMYIIGTIATVILCQKWDFNKLLIFILRRIIFKILCFLIAMLFFLISFTLNDIRDILEHSLIILPFLISALVGLTHTIKLIHQNTAIIPDAYHDTKKLLMLLDIKAQKATDVDKLKDMLSESMDLMNLRLPNLCPSVSNTEDINFEKFIKRTIESVKIDKKSNTKIISNIQFSDKYSEINDLKLAYMIGSLLDHALDTLTKRPIFIDITSSKHHFLIQISCEYKFEKSIKHLKNFLVDNEIVRAKIENNFNLSKLKSIVDTYNGGITIAREKNSQEQVDYLSICLIFEKEGGSLE